MAIPKSNKKVSVYLIEIVHKLMDEAGYGSDYEDVYVAAAFDGKIVAEIEWGTAKYGLMVADFNKVASGNRDLKIEFTDYHDEFKEAPYSIDTSFKDAIVRKNPLWKKLYKLNNIKV